MSTFTFQGRSYAMITCGECGIEWAVPERWQTARVEDKKDFYCPNGHCRAYVESKADKLQRELNNAKQQMARVEDEKADAERRLAQAEAATKRLKKRASAGNCPCCKRTFANMAQHMKHQHPEFVKQGGAKVVPIKAAS